MNMNNKVPQLFISEEEAAGILGVHKRTVRRMILSGKVRAKDINASNGIRHKWRVFKEDIIKLDTIRT